MIVIPVSDSDAFLEPARAKKIPVVLLDRNVPGGRMDCVHIDNRGAAVEAAELILEKQHKKIAVIYSGRESTGMERYRGFIQTIHKAGIRLPEAYEKRGVHSIEHGYDSMKELLELEEKPTAVFMTNYEITLGAIMALQESASYSVKDFFIMGFDNLLLTHLVDSHIYVVVQPMQELAESAAKLLLDRVEGKIETSPLELILPTYIEETNSGKKWKD
jgi:LacI family transcriptional regulator